MSTLELLKPSEAAEYLRTATKTLEKWRVLGLGPQFTKVGGRVFYQKAHLDAWVASQVRGSTSAR